MSTDIKSILRQHRDPMRHGGIWPLGREWTAECDHRARQRKIKEFFVGVLIAAVLVGMVAFAAWAVR